jgi:hypothetical protein
MDEEPRSVIPDRSERVRLWGEMAVNFYNKGVDKDINELVVGLNIIGCRTFASCGGHYNSTRLYKQTDGSYYQWWKHPYVAFPVKPEDVPYHPNMASLQQLIDEFNEKNKIDPKYRIMLTAYGKRATQISAGGINTIEVPNKKGKFFEAEREAIA